jgi:hypothetical protein
MKYPNTLYTILLSIVLLVPFAIRWLAPTLEPYPAVLLPSGAGTVKLTERNIDFYTTAIYGRVAGRDDWIRLSPPEFLYPIPAEFFPDLAQRYFGLIPDAPNTYYIRKVGAITIDAHRVSERGVENARQWFRARLSNNGFDDSTLRIAQEVVTLRRSDGAQIAVRYQDEKVFKLR